VSELLARWSSRELAELLALDQLDPMGTWREDHRAALICAVLARSLGGARVTPKDFMPRFGESGHRTQTTAEQIAIARRITAACNAIEGRTHGRHRQPGRRADRAD